MPGWVFVELLLSPVLRYERARLSIKSAVSGLIGIACPGPLSRPGCYHPDSPDVAAIPEAIDAFRKVRPLQFDPGIHVLVRVLMTLGGTQNDLLYFPRMDRLSRKRNESEQEQQNRSNN